MPVADARLSSSGSPRGWRRLGWLDLEVGIRAGIAVGVPLLLLLSAGRLDLAPYAAFGAMTALYGRNEPYRLRARSLLLGALTLLTALGAGAVISTLGAQLWLVGVGLVGVLALSILVAQLGQLFPPTPVFQAFAFLVCVQAPVPAGGLGVRFGIGAAAAAFAILICLSGWLIRSAVERSGRRALRPLLRTPELRPARLRSAEVWLSVAQTVLAALAAGVLALGLGQGHAYWAVVSAVAVIPPAGAPHSVSRALHRVWGTLGGVIIAGAVLLPDPPPLLLIGVIALCQLLAEVLIGRSYGVALLFVTPLALAVVQLVTPQPVAGMLVDRVLATVLGAAIGVVFVLGLRWVSRWVARGGHAR